MLLAVGGAEEILYAKPGDYRVVLKTRKGFARLAIKAGASLVPMYTFGEVDLYDQPPNERGSRIREYQDAFKRWTGAPSQYYHNCGFDMKYHGVLPHQRKLTTVVGAPIPTVKIESPTIEEIDSLHEKYVNALVKLFDDHKKSYIDDWENAHLIPV